MHCATCAAPPTRTHQDRSCILLCHVCAAVHASTSALQWVGGFAPPPPLPASSLFPPTSLAWCSCAPTFHQQTPSSETHIHVAAKRKHTPHCLACIPRFLPPPTHCLLAWRGCWRAPFTQPHFLANSLLHLESHHPHTSFSKPHIHAANTNSHNSLLASLAS